MLSHFDTLSRRRLELASVVREERRMTNFLTILGLLSALVLVGASATMNALFSFSLGRTSVEGTILCSVSLAVDVMKALLVVFIAWAARDGRKGFIAVGSCVFMLFTVASLLQSMGFVALNRSTVADDQSTRALRQSESRKALEEMERQRRTLGSHRPLAVMDVLLAGLAISPHWVASIECSRPASSAARSFCQSAIALKAEAATAREAVRLDTMIGELRGQHAMQEATTSPDPQARLLADAFGLSVDQVRRLLMGLIAVVVELASSLGIYLATGHSHRGPTRNVVQRTDDDCTARSESQGAASSREMRVAVVPTENATSVRDDGRTVRVGIRSKRRGTNDAIEQRLDHERDGT